MMALKQAIAREERGERVCLKIAWEGKQLKAEFLDCAEDHRQIANWLKELEWYRNQDLIRREDALEVARQPLSAYGIWKELQGVERCTWEEK